MDSLVGNTFGSFRLTGFIEQRGFTASYSGSEEGSEEPRRVLLCGGDACSEESPVRKRFREVAFQAVTARVPGVPTVVGYGQEQDYDFMVQAVPEGEALEAALEKEGPLAFEKAREILEDVGQALQKVVEAGLAESLVDAGGVCVTADGQIVLAHILDASRRDLLHAWGLDAQQHEGLPLQEVDHVRALGGLFYQLLTGTRRPKHKWKIETARAVTMDSALAEAPDCAREFLKRCLAPGPENFTDIESALHALAHAEEGIPPAPTGPVEEEALAEEALAEEALDEEVLDEEVLDDHAPVEELTPEPEESAELDEEFAGAEQPVEELAEEPEPGPVEPEVTAVRSGPGAAAIFVSVFGILAVAGITFLALEEWRKPKSPQSSPPAPTSAIPDYKQSKAWVYADTLQKVQVLSAQKKFGEALDLLDKFESSHASTSYAKYARRDADLIQTGAEAEFEGLMKQVKRLKRKGKTDEAVKILDRIVENYGIPAMVEEAGLEKQLLSQPPVEPGPPEGTGL